MSSRGPRHVDHFIDFGTGPIGENKNDGELYARYMLMHFRLPAILQMAFAPFIDGKRLFCTHNLRRMRVTGASTLGDVWLVLDFKQSDGYDARVNVEECSAWGAEP